MEKNYSIKRHGQKLIYAFFLIILAGIDLGFSQPFTRHMEIPDLYDRRADSLFVDVETHDFGVPGWENVQTLAYNHEFSGSNDYLGPTLTWMVGDTQSTSILNRLPVIPGRGNNSTVHWHGANIPAWTDGGPHQFFSPNERFTPKFKVIDAPATLWYHPHAEDVTYTQVQMGLAGIIIVRETGDPVEAIAPSTYGHDDIPLIIQDIHFTADDKIDTTKGPGGAPVRTMMVNGTVQPYLDVYPQPFRFRMLNGSTRNGYMLSFVTDTTDPAGSKVPFSLLASDGGYLYDNVQTVTSIETGPGIRNEVIVDFSNFGGSTLYLMNVPDELDAAIIGSSMNKPPLKNVLLELRVAANSSAPIGAIPSSLPSLPPVDTLPPDTSRIIRLTGMSGGGASAFGIDDNQYDFNKINTIVRLNTIEDWTVKNETNVAHPFHIHLIQFHVMRVEMNDGTLIGDINSTTNPLPPKYLGPKDNILVHAGEQVTFRARFHTYGRPKPFTTGGQLDSAAYMYHCHILTHEDGYYSNTPGTIVGRSPFGMMQQFAVWDGTTTALENPIDENMHFYPNPAGDKVFLNGESPKMSKVRISDIQGRILMEKALPPFMGSTSVDVSQLGRGLILMEWISPDSRQIKKIILE